MVYYIKDYLIQNRTNKATLAANIRRIAVTGIVGKNAHITVIRLQLGLKIDARLCTKLSDCIGYQSFTESFNGT